MIKKGRLLGKCWDSAYGCWLRRRQHVHAFLVFFVLPFLFVVLFLIPKDPVLLYIGTSFFLLGFLGIIFLSCYLTSVFVHWLSGELRSFPHPLPPIQFYTKGLLYPGKPTVGRESGFCKKKKPIFIPYADIAGIYLSRNRKRDSKAPRQEPGLVIMTVSGEFFQVPMLFKDSCHGWLERTMAEEGLEELLENDFFRGRLPWYLESALGMLWVGTRVEGATEGF